MLSHCFFGYSNSKSWLHMRGSKTCVPNHATLFDFAAKVIFARPSLSGDSMLTHPLCDFRRCSRDGACVFCVLLRFSLGTRAGAGRINPASRWPGPSASKAEKFCFSDGPWSASGLYRMPCSCHPHVGSVPAWCRGRRFVSPWLSAAW